MQVGPVHHQIACAALRNGGFAQVEALLLLPGVPQPDLLAGGQASELVEPGADPELDQAAGGVGAQLETGADSRQRRSLLVDVDLESPLRRRARASVVSPPSPPPMIATCVAPTGMDLLPVVCADRNSTGTACARARAPLPAYATRRAERVYWRIAVCSARECRPTGAGDPGHGSRGVQSDRSSQMNDVAKAVEHFVSAQGGAVLAIVTAVKNGNLGDARSKLETLSASGPVVAIATRVQSSESFASGFQSFVDERLGELRTAGKLMQVVYGLSLVVGGVWIGKMVGLLLVCLGMALLVKTFAPEFLRLMEQLAADLEVFRV
jgi:hypothetical protein